VSNKDFANPTLETQVPGNVNPRDRFQRATYFLSVLTKPTSERAGVAGMFGLIRIVDPLRRASQRLHLRHRIQNRQQHDGPALLLRADHGPERDLDGFTKLNFAEGAPVLMLNPNNIDLSGDVTSQFQPAKAPF
jgi:hypothetical protein